jgi:hypothetical protein
LNELVCIALGGLPAVQIVQSSDADIVIASVNPSGADGDQPEPTYQNACLILFDPGTNLMGIRRPGEGLHLRPGGLETVLETVQEWTQD